MFSERMNTELVQQFWSAMQQSVFITEAAEQVGTYREMGTRWLAATGGIRPRRGRNLKGRCLSLRDREEIALSRAAGESMRSIAARMGRHPSTISRELAGNSVGDGRYRATTAHALAYQRASRPKPGKLVANPVLRQRIEQDLTKRYSPEQIVGRLPLEFPQDPAMHIAVETIYRSLYLPSCGGLHRDLTRCLRTGRRLRRPRRQAGQRKNRIQDMVNIAQRPAEAEDRALPGHWEGDLIVGRNNRSAIGTLVERATGWTVLVHLPDGYKPDQLREPLTRRLLQLPAPLRRSLTWDQGPEMRDWKEVAAAAGVDIYFCDPHSPWQRGVNENTNGLLRQYFPKGTDLSVHSREDLERVAAELNDRPRKRLGFHKPIELIGPLLR
jgi:transposase, IS30 family